MPLAILGGSPLLRPRVACKLVYGGTRGFRTMMPQSRDRLGAWEGGTNLDGGVLQP